jgi:ketosteroid isomerase-like protein
MAVVLEQLTERVRALEDQIALFQTMSSYGPSVDSMSVQEAASIWTEDGVYDVGSGPVPPMHGRDEIAAMLEGPNHGTLVEQGCAHVMTMPLVKVDGDVAVGIAYHRLYVRDGDGFRIWRLTASRWDWVRRADGWKVKRRTHRLMDGSEDARQLLRDSLLEIRGS